MNFIGKKSITIGIITLTLGVLAACGAARLVNQSSTVQGMVVAFIMNPEGRVAGAVLDTGDQIRFGAETGAIVGEQVKIGGTLNATGHAGTKSDYGRELRAVSLQIGDRTITVLHSKPKPPRGGDKPKPRPGDERREKPHPEDGRMPPPADGQAPPAPETDDANAPRPELNAAPIPAPTATLTTSANGQVKIVLVGAKGEARGLILSGGEQIDLPKEVSDANLTIGQGTEVSAEGVSAKSDTGTFIRPTRLTIGSQTFSFNR